MRQRGGLEVADLWRWMGVHGAGDDFTKTTTTKSEIGKGRWVGAFGRVIILLGGSND